MKRRFFLEGVEGICCFFLFYRALIVVRKQGGGVIVRAEKLVPTGQRYQQERFFCPRRPSGLVGNLHTC